MEASRIPVDITVWEATLTSYVTNLLDAGVDPEEIQNTVEGAVDDYGNEVE